MKEYLVVARKAALLAGGLLRDNLGGKRTIAAAKGQGAHLNGKRIRRDGSAALDLCSVAAGRFDGFWELKLKPWDVAAGSLIVREAGGTISDFRGMRSSIHDQEIVASNGMIHSKMLAILQK